MDVIFACANYNPTPVSLKCDLCSYQFLSREYLSLSPYLNHFLQPDSIIPNPASPQSWNRFSYTGNNPVNYSDPTGHVRVGDEDVSRNKFGINCKTHGRYCNDGKPKTPEELLAMRPKKVKVPRYGDGLIGPPAPPYGAYSTFFQLLPVIDPYNYAQSAAESYNDFPGGGGYEAEAPAVSAAASVPGLLNEMLLGYQPTYYANNIPYDQSVFLTYTITYQNAPLVDATRVVTLNSMEIRNGSNINRSVNYSIGITTADHSFFMQKEVNAGPGQTATVPLGGITGGLNIAISAFTGCTSPCIRNPNDTTLFRGFIRFIFNP